MTAYKAFYSKFQIGNCTKLCFKTEKFEENLHQDGRRQEKSDAHDLNPAIRPP